MKRYKRILFCFIVLLFSFQLPMQNIMYSRAETQDHRTVGRDYYISSINGDNQNDASDPSRPWQTLDRLNKITLQPGDRILLESGSVFNGFIHLRNVHGTVEHPIIIKSYGEGEKPIINANGEGVWYQDYGKELDNPGHKVKGYVSSTLLIYDSSFIEVSDLELTNISDDWNYMPTKSDQLKNRMERTGVAGIAQNIGTMEHIYLDNLYIHDIDGNLETKHLNNGGIQFNVSKPENEEETGIARFHDIKITNNHIQNASRSGISIGYTYNHDKFKNAEIPDDMIKEYGHTNILVEGNYVQEVGNDGIVVMYADRPLIRNNVAHKTGVDLAKGYPGYWMSFSAGIWSWKTKNALFEYNEVFDLVGDGNGDGQAWDIDYSDGTVYQYNYSHNNGGGALLVCLYDSVNGTFRYNISQNDLKSFLTFQGNPLVEIYNNVFYVDGDRNTRIHHPDAGKRSGQAYIANNIFYNASSNNPNDEWNPNNNKEFTNNIYYGYDTVPENDKYAITEDPLFVAAGTAPKSTTGVISGLDAFKGFKLKENSPAINAGVYIPNNAADDYFGNPIGLIPDIGIHEIDAAEEDVYEIYTDVYTIFGERILGIQRETTVEEFLKNIKKTTSTIVEVKRGDMVLNKNDVIQINDVLIATFVSSFIKEYRLELEKTYTEYPADGITAKAGSIQSGEDASKALDGDINTIWHSSWGGANQEDLWISFDLQEVKPISMLKYVPRQKGGINGIFIKYSIYVKEKESDDWQKVMTYGNTWALDYTTKYAYFDTVHARYIKLQADESATQQAPTLFGSAAEIRVGYENSLEEV